MEANRVLLQFLYKKIILRFSELSGKTIEESLELFYESQTYKLVSQGIADMHCKGARYLADELMIEYGIKEIRNLDVRC